MAHGNFKQYHFGFVGDGRSNSTDPSSSPLGNREELCRRIICNAAACLMDAGWTWDSDCKAFSDYAEGTSAKSLEQYSIVSPNTGNNYTIHLYHDSTAMVMEVPLMYDKYGDGTAITHIWLVYCYCEVNYSVTTSASNHSMIKYLGEKWGWLYNKYETSYTAGVSGLSILYLPPNTSNIETSCFKLAAGSGYYTSSSSAYPISRINDNNQNYTYQFICRDDFIALFLRVSNTTSLQATFIGEMLDELKDPADTTYNNRKYACIVWKSSGSTENSTSYNLIASNNTQIGICQSSSYIPWLQFYNVDGIIQTTANHYTRGGYGMFWYNSVLLRALNTSADDLHYSNVLIGNVPCNIGTYDAKLARVSSSNYIKGTIHEDFLIAVDQTYEEGSYYKPRLSVGQTLENGKYIYLGNGFCMGWDPNNSMTIFGDFTNPMATPTLVN